VLGEQQLATAASDEERVRTLDLMLSDAVSFLMNIHCRYIFENSFYEERAAGELTAGRLSELMAEAQKKAYCGALDEDCLNPGFWISKLHFYITYTPFYNFPFTFGYLLSLGVYALGKDDDAGFPERYRQLLIATGCQNSEDAVQSSLGYSLEGDEFWNRSLDIVEARVQEFLKLTE
jgi:oligoendopeptidase F